MGAILCFFGFHKWREHLRVEWELSHVKAYVGLRICRRCSLVHRDDARQTRENGRIAGAPTNFKPTSEGGRDE